MLDTASPFHSGEVEAQARSGVTDLASRVGKFIRDYMPDQHRTFFASQPFLVMASADRQGRPWITMVEGPDGFVTSPDPRTLMLGTEIDPRDPLADTFATGGDVGIVGIELATRRRNRLSGIMRSTSEGFIIDVRQSFGNCPQYINERDWRRTEKAPADAKTSKTLNATQMTLIRAADTMFIGSGQQDDHDSPANGYDASHRGGSPGFVEVVDDTRVRIPDYSGNNFFNTIGNLVKNPSVALLFVDFESGSLLHLSGHAQIDWNPENPQETGIHRYIDVTITDVNERPGALGLRWEADDKPARQLSLVRKVPEAEDITSFYFEPVDGRPPEPFTAGQHLPIEVSLGPSSTRVQRSYSLSAAPNGRSYRMSIKREAQGAVSRFMHDVLQTGDVIDASAPAGDFGLPGKDDPVVLVSAGVGITPMMAMLQQIVLDGARRPTWFVHSARNGSTHAMGDEVRKLAQDHIQTRLFYSQPRCQDRIGRDYDVAGRLSVRDLLDLNTGTEAHYMLCGPPAFVADLRDGLETAGVPAGQIHFETF
ncbi:MAG: pyridoxamine 5'-phosphate oxidase family protein [Pseudomonadota bacterium]